MAKARHLTRVLKRYVSQISYIDDVTDVVICGHEKKKKGLGPGVYYDPKARAGYTRGTNGIPLMLIDPKAEGVCHIIVYASPGNYDKVVSELDKTIIISGRRKSLAHIDHEINMHIENIKSLIYDVRQVRMGRPIELERSYASGVHEPKRTDDHLDCLVVGLAPMIGVRPRIVPYPGKADDVEYILENYHEYFGI